MFTVTVEHTKIKKKEPGSGPILKYNKYTKKSFLHFLKLCGAIENIH